MVSPTRPPSVVLRDYRSSDLEAMFQLDEVCFAAEFRFDRASMLVFAEARNALVVVAEDPGSEVVGFVIAHLEPVATGQRGYIVTLDVAESRRRQRLAERLMREAEARAAAAGALWMELHVFTGNEGAIRFYERLGYVRIGVRSRFYGAAGLNAFVYRRDLSQRFA
jgi:[ribosomal protein S18]-alanine N-acetyltransferase